MVTWTTIAGSTFEIGTYAIALFRGGRPERTVATALLLNFAAAPFLQDAHHLRSVQYGLLAGDICVLAVVLYCTFTSNRRWLLFGAARQVLAVLTHFAVMNDNGLDVWAYLTGAIIISDGLILSLLLGTLLEAAPARRSRRNERT